MRTTTATVAAACLAALSVGEAAAQESLSDPWEGTNRHLFAIHESVDQAVLEPVARGYRAGTPGFFRAGVNNFLRNLRGPVIFANDVMQGELPRAGTTAARFGINSTVGLAGLVDVADHMGLERHDEDFGQTLAVWGVDPGPYVFVPLMGPTTVRDAFGRVVDVGLSPLTWAEFDGESEFLAARTVLGGVSTREQLLETVDSVRGSAIDPYVDFRVGYGLAREAAIQNGRDVGQDSSNFDATMDDEISALSQGMEETPAVTAETPPLEPNQ